MNEQNEQGAPEPRVVIWCDRIAAAALVVMMLVVVADVVLRQLFNTPLRGAYDMVSIALLVMVMFGIGPVIARRGEILIDLIDGLVSTRSIRALGVLAGVLSLAVFVFLAWSMVTPALDAWRYGDRSLELGIPQWTLWGVAFVGLLGIFAGLLIQLRAALQGPAEPPSEEGGL